MSEGDFKLRQPRGDIKKQKPGTCSQSNISSLMYSFVCVAFIFHFIF